MLLQPFVKDWTVTCFSLPALCCALRVFGFWFLPVTQKSTHNFFKFYLNVRAFTSECNLCLFNMFLVYRLFTDLHTLVSIIHVISILSYKLLRKIQLEWFLKQKLVIELQFSSPSGGYEKASRRWLAGWGTEKWSWCCPSVLINFLLASSLA